MQSYEEGEFNFKTQLNIEVSNSRAEKSRTDIRFSADSSRSGAINSPGWLADNDRDSDLDCSGSCGTNRLSWYYLYNWLCNILASQGILGGLVVDLAKMKLGVFADD